MRSLLEIIEWVAADKSRRPYAYVTNRGKYGLYQLSLVSRHINTLTKPILYRSFLQIRGRKTTGQFLGRVLAEPALRSYVRQFTVSKHTGRYGALLGDLLDTSGFEEEWDKCTTAIQEFGESWLSEDSISDFGDIVTDGDWQALTALLLSLLPNVEEVDLVSYENNTEAEYNFLHQFFCHAAELQMMGTGEESQHAMKRLRQISVTYHDIEAGFDFEDIKPFLLPKSLQTAYIHKLFEDGSSDFTGPEKFSITDLTLSRSVIEAETFKHLILKFPHLKRFSYDYCHLTMNEDASSHEYIGVAIEHLKPCLEELVVLDYSQHALIEEETPLPIGALNQFEKLHVITISYDVIIGENHGFSKEVEGEMDKIPGARLVEVLPTALQTLRIHHCLDIIMDQTRELLGQREKLVPLLTYISLSFLDLPANDQVVESLKTDCKAAGIELVIESQA